MERFEETFCVEVELLDDGEARATIRTSVDPSVRAALTLTGSAQYVEEALVGMRSVSGYVEWRDDALTAAADFVAGKQPEG